MLAVFAAARGPALGLPYFWDELGVYSQAALYLYDHGPSLLPGAIDPDLSRGHPLLYTFLMSLVFRVFGPSVTVGHGFNLVVTLAAIAAVFAFGRRYFSPSVGLTAAALFALQPVVVAQSVMVLPEMMLCLFALLAVHFYLAGRRWAYFACASAAMLTKETGVLVPIALSLWAFFDAARTRGRAGGDGSPRGVGQVPVRAAAVRSAAMRAAAPLAPIVTLAAFLFVQRVQNGWFLFPLHADLVSLAPADLASRFYRGVYFFFVDQGRYWLVVLAIAAAVRGRIGGGTLGERRAAGALAVFIGVMIVFSTLNYQMNRYYLLVVPALVLLAAHLYRSGAVGTRRGRVVFALLYLAGTAPFMFVFWRFNTDLDLSYQIPLATLRHGVEFVERDTAGADRVRVCAGFPASNAFRDPRQGYIRTARYAVATTVDGSADFLIETSPGVNPGRPAGVEARKVFSDESFYSRVDVYRIEAGGAAGRK